MEKYTIVMCPRGHDIYGVTPAYPLPDYWRTMNCAECAEDVDPDESNWLLEERWDDEPDGGA